MKFVPPDNLDYRNPREDFLFGRFPNQKPGGKGPSSKHLVQILRGGSSSRRKRNPEEEAPPLFEGGPLPPGS